MVAEKHNSGAQFLFRLLVTTSRLDAIIEA